MTADTSLSVTSRKNVPQLAVSQPWDVLGICTLSQEAEKVPYVTSLATHIFDGDTEEVKARVNIYAAME